MKNERRVKIEYKSGKKETHDGYAVKEDDVITVHISSPNPRRNGRNHEIIIPASLVRSAENIGEKTCYICRNELEEGPFLPGVPSGANGIYCRECGYYLGYGDWNVINRQETDKKSKIELKKILESRAVGIKRDLERYDGLIVKLSL